MPRKTKKTKKKKDRSKALSKEELEGYLISEYDFNPESLNELYDALQQTREVAHHYLATTASYSPPLRKEILEITFDFDSLFLTFNELYILSNGLSYKARKKLGGKRIEVDKQDLEDFLELFKQARRDLKYLIHRLKDYVDKIKHFEKPRTFIA